MVPLNGSIGLCGKDLYVLFAFMSYVHRVIGFRV